MKKWMGISLVILLLLCGCPNGRNGTDSPGRSAGPGAYAVPLPHPSQERDTGAITGPAASALPPAPAAPPAAAPGSSPSSDPAQLPIVNTAPAVPEQSAQPPSAKEIEQHASAKQKEAASKRETGLARRIASGGESAGSGAKRYSLTELRRKYSSTFIFQGSGADKRIALTFDDAPDTFYTPKVLDILKKHRVKATFFLVGYRAAAYPEVVRRINREGHIVGNHSYGHAQLKKLSRPKFIQEIERAERVLVPLVGYTPRLVRPPYGAINDEELAWLARNGYLTVNWNVDPQDWRGVSKESVLERTLLSAAPGAIILMHSATGTGGSLQGTVQALPEVIETLQNKGYKLVTLPELLQTPKEK